MGLQPNIQKKGKFVLKQCAVCGSSYGPEGFAPTKSPFYPDGALPLCNKCVDRILADQDYEWNVIDKFCQMTDIPFSPKQWTEVAEQCATAPFYKYAEIFLAAPYDRIDWTEYYKKFKALEEDGNIASALPRLSDEQRETMRAKWGAYDDDGYAYLENLYTGLTLTQSINGKLQKDQAEKICKISYEINRRIAAGEDFDKLLASYDKLIKAAEFTPKNTKNANDFESVGEVFKYMESRGWRNGFYDGVKRDIVDETIASMQNFNQRLYTQEVSIGDEISRRIQALQTAKSLEQEDNFYGTRDIAPSDNYDASACADLMAEEEKFSIEEDIDG